MKMFWETRMDDVLGVMKLEWTKMDKVMGGGSYRERR